MVVKAVPGGYTFGSGPIFGNEGLFELAQSNKKGLGLF